MHIALACDHFHLTPFFVLLTSLFDKNKMNIHLHLIITGINEKEKDAITNYANKNDAEVNFYAIDETLVSDFPVFIFHSATTAIYYRLLFPFLVPNEVERLLYIDTDIVVLGNLSQVMNTDLKGHPVAAVVDGYSAPRKDLGITKVGEYFNSGVLLMDIKEWKKQHITERTIQFIIDNPKKLAFGDQCALNAVLVNNWLKLDPSYNVMFSNVPAKMSRKHLRASLKGKLLLHFTTGQKPWRFMCKNPYKFIYQEYLSKAPVGRKARKYTDLTFTRGCIKAFIRIKLHDLTYEAPLLRNLWDAMKERRKELKK
jgi:lipopolysaccharide biosynthesis glycosyltransferase